MRGFKSIFSIVLAVLFLSSIQSFADTFVVTNLNDPGAGSLRQAITNSNLTPGPDEIVFEEGLEGTIFLNVGPMQIGDDLTINGPDGGRITIDAGAKSPILDINDGDEGKNSIVNINGLRFINGIAGNGSEIDNSENLTVNSCQFLDGKGGDGAAIYNRRFLTVDSCLFENNSADFGGGAIFNEGIILSINNSTFRFNDADTGGAISNKNIIESITSSTFNGNSGFFGGAVSNESGTIEEITDSTFSGNSGDDGGAINNFLGTINEISHSTFNNNITTGKGGAITNICGFIETIVNSTFNENSARGGGAIWNDGIINISFTTISGNQSIRAGGGGITTLPCRGILPLGKYRIRNSIIAFNSPNNCSGPVNDLIGNWSNDSSCGFLGDNFEIILGPLADNGGPTETMALLGGDPIDGATNNCDALNEMGNPTGIPIGIDQRYFPRPFGVRCDSGAVEAGPESIVTITKASEPPGRRGFEFESDGFSSLVGCGFTGDNGNFILDDGDSISCIVPQGDYSIKENIPQGYELLIICLEAPDNIVINNETGEIDFTIVDSSSDVDCVFTNIRTEDGGDGGGCTLAPAGERNMIPLYLFIPVLILIRRIVKRSKS